MGGLVGLVRQRWDAAPGFRGAFYMLVYTFASTGMHGLVRYLSVEVPTFELVFFRNFFGFVCLLPWLIRSGFVGFRSARLWVHGLRGLLGIAGISTWFYGLSLLPLAEATALNFTATIFTTLGATLFLGETMYARRWLAVVVGFGGVFVMLRPGIEVVSVGAIVVIISALLWSGSLLVLKRLTGTDSPVTIVGTLYVFLILFSIGPAIYVWRTPDLVTLVWLVLMGAISAVSHITLAKAFEAAEAGKLMPLDFTRLVWAALIGWWVLAEVPDIWTWAGGTLIFFGSMLTGMKDRKKPS